MRVLMLADLSAPGCRATAVADGLRATGHDVELLASGGASRVATVVPEYPPRIPSWDAVSGALQRDLALLERAVAVMMRAPADVVHASGWRAAYAAAGIRDAFGVPVVASFDRLRALERRGRRWGRGDDLIEQTERWLAEVSERVVVRSGRARALVSERFEVPTERIELIASVRPERLGPRYASALLDAASARGPVRALARA